MVMRFESPLVYIVFTLLQLYYQNRNLMASDFEATNFLDIVLKELVKCIVDLQNFPFQGAISFWSKGFKMECKTCKDSGLSRLPPSPIKVDSS